MLLLTPIIPPIKEDNIDTIKWINVLNVRPAGSRIKEVKNIIKKIMKETISPLTIPPLPIFLEEINPAKKEPTIRQIDAITDNKFKEISKSTKINEARIIVNNVNIIPTRDESRYIIIFSL